MNYCFSRAVRSYLKSLTKNCVSKRFPFRSTLTKIAFFSLLLLSYLFFQKTLSLMRNVSLSNFFIPLPLPSFPPSSSYVPFHPPYLTLYIHYYLINPFLLHSTNRVKKRQFFLNFLSPPLPP